MISFYSLHYFYIFKTETEIQAMLEWFKQIHSFRQCLLSKLYRSTWHHKAEMSGDSEIMWGKDFT